MAINRHKVHFNREDVKQPILFLLAIILIFLALSLLCGNAFAVTEFVSYMNKTGEDYNTFALWEAATDEDLTLATIKVFSYDTGSGDAIEDGDAVTTGASTGVCVHQTIRDSGQILIKTISGVDFINGATVTGGAGETVVLRDNGDSPIVTLYCYDDGEFTL